MLRAASKCLLPHSSAHAVLRCTQQRNRDAPLRMHPHPRLMCLMRNSVPPIACVLNLHARLPPPTGAAGCRSPGPTAPAAALALHTIRTCGGPACTPPARADRVTDGPCAGERMRVCACASACSYTQLRVKRLPHNKPLEACLYDTGNCCVQACNCVRALQSCGFLCCDKDANPADASLALLLPRCTGLWEHWEEDTSQWASWWVPLITQ